MTRPQTLARTTLALLILTVGWKLAPAHASPPPADSPTTPQVQSKLLRVEFDHQLHTRVIPLFAATSTEATPGGYYGPNGFQELKGDPVPVKIAPAAKDPAVAKRLWSVTEQLTGVPFNIA